MDFAMLHSETTKFAIEEDKKKQLQATKNHQ